MCGVMHMTVVSLIYMPMDVPKSSKLQRIPVTSPFRPDGRAIHEEKKMVKMGKIFSMLELILGYSIWLLTFKEECIVVSVNVYLGEFADTNLLRHRILD